MLGSGTAVPVRDRFPAGYLVRIGTFRALVDLGPGVLRRLPALGLDLDAIDAVLLTHYHTDHCADLAALLFGFATNLRTLLTNLGSPIPSEFMAMLPYVVTVLAVVGFAGQVRGPAAAGKPYIKG